MENVSWDKQKFNPLDDFDNISNLIRSDLQRREPILFLSSTQMVVYFLTYLRVKRCKIVEIDCNNVSIYLSQKDRLKIDGIMQNVVVHGVNYNMYDLPFWECRIKKYKVMR
jgi:hypothetical protein